MMTRFKNLFVALGLLLAGIVLPTAAHAAALSFSLSPQQVYAGDVFTAQLNLDAQGQKINVANASVYFDPNLLEVEDVTTGGSIFNMWTRAPIYDDQVGKVTFTGGATAAFSGSSGEVVNIVFYAKQAGQANIALAVDSALYLADGSGTKVAPHLNNALVLITNPPVNYTSTNQWDKLLAADKIPPQNLQITLGKDPSVFNGQYFISFSATDDQSGINYYAVKEGNGDFVQAESPYVLKDQSLSGSVTVKAVDKAGNVAEQTLVLKQGGIFNSRYAIWALALLILILINVVWVVVVFRIKRKK